MVLNLDTIDPFFQTWLIGDIIDSDEINDNKIFNMVGAIVLVDRCFKVRLREHGCISMFREILYRSNSAVDSIPVFT